MVKEVKKISPLILPGERKKHISPFGTQCIALFFFFLSFKKSLMRLEPVKKIAEIIKIRASMSLPSGPTYMANSAA